MTPSPSRVVSAPDPARFLFTDDLIWFEEPPDLPPEIRLLGMSPERRFAVTGDPDPGTGPYRGIYGVYPITLTVPGGPGGPGALRRLPVAGLTWVGVHPDHRRRGVLTAMMRDHLDRTADAGICVSALHASEVAIYGRFGYGQAVATHAVTLGRGSTLRAGRTEAAADRLVTEFISITDDAVADRLRAVAERVAQTELGAVVFGPELYRKFTIDPPNRLRDNEIRRVLFARDESGDVGSALIRRHSRWENDRANGSVEVWVLQASPTARLALLRRLVDLDLTGSTVLYGVGSDDPLLHWAGGLRGPDAVRPADNLWIRLVDLPAALTARGYATEVDVVLEVADAHRPDNAGRWRLTVRDGIAHVDRTTARADLSLDVAALGAAYLGSAGNLVAMHRAGLIEEHSHGAVSGLWRAMRCDVAATPVQVF